MMRAAVIHIGQETNDFNPEPTTLTGFRQFGIHEGDEILGRMAGRGQVGGMLDAVAETGMNIDWVPTISAWAMAGGRIDTESRLFFEERIGTGRVRRVTGGVVKVAVFQQPEFDQGITVIFEVGPVTLFITERSGAVGNVPDVYRAFGIEPAEYQMAVLKTASNFQFFAPISAQVILPGPG